MEALDPKLHPVPVLPEDRPLPARERTFKVWFRTPTVSASSLPEFPYIASALDANAITYVALIRARKADDLQSLILGRFDRPTILRVVEDEIDFNHRDYLVGASVWGIVPPGERPSLLRSILCFWK